MYVHNPSAVSQPREEEFGNLTYASSPNRPATLDYEVPISAVKPVLNKGHEIGNPTYTNGPAPASLFDLPVSEGKCKCWTGYNTISCFVLQLHPYAEVKLSDISQV